VVLANLSGAILVQKQTYHEKYHYCRSLDLILIFKQKRRLQKPGMWKIPAPGQPITAWSYGHVPTAQMNGQPLKIPANVAPGQQVDLSVSLTARQRLPRVV